jgi:hypothetical protein
MLAAAHAYEWQRAAPGSRVAVQALCESALATGLAVVYAHAAQRLRSLDGKSALPPIDSADAPLSVLSLEQAEAIDLSRMHLADDNPAAAAAMLQGVDHPLARKNLALALFISGELARTREDIEANGRSILSIAAHWSQRSAAVEGQQYLRDRSLARRSHGQAHDR